MGSNIQFWTKARNAESTYDEGNCQKFSANDPCNFKFLKLANVTCFSIKVIQNLAIVNSFPWLFSRDLSKKKITGDILSTIFFTHPSSVFTGLSWFYYWKKTEILILVHCWSDIVSFRKVTSSIPTTNPQSNSTSRKSDLGYIFWEKMKKTWILLEPDWPSW